MSGTTRARPRKSLGQHWLTDRDALRRIAAAADFRPADTVIEVGPGTGLLTQLLAQRATNLIAVEVDHALAEQLRRRYAETPGVTVIEADVLETPVEEILNAGRGGLPYVVAGNLPYMIGTAIVRKFLRAAVRPRWLVVTLQLEVAERMTAVPGRMSYLSAEMQLFAEARILFRLPPGAFQPPPKVRSAVVRLDVRDSPDVEVDDVDAFLSLVQAGFAAPRKRLRNSLAIGLRLPAAIAERTLALAGVDPALRPAALSLEDWRKVYFAHRRRGREGAE